MNTREQYYEIIAGPNKDTLFDACKYAPHKSVRIPVEFSVALAYTMPKDHPACACIPMPITDISIYGIEHEDGSGESFNIHGYCKADLSPFNGLKDAVYSNYRFKAYFNTKHRKGSISFSK